MLEIHGHARVISASDIVLRSRGETRVEPCNTITSYFDQVQSLAYNLLIFVSNGVRVSASDT